MDISIFVFVFAIFCNLVSSQSDAGFHMCTSNPDVDCLADECLTVHEQPCFHGDCNKGGTCECRPCWAGPFCNESVNHHHPVFRDPSYIAMIPIDAKHGFFVREVNAYDGDNPRCNTDKECECADVHFSLNSFDKMAPELKINDKGEIFLGYNGPLQPGVYEYKLYVRNPDGLQGSNAPLTVFVEEEGGNYWDTVVKSRQLRAAPDTSGLTNLGDNTLDSAVALDPADASITTVQPGHAITIIFTATFPLNKYVEDVVIETFTDDINGTFAFLCKPTVTVGGNLAVDTDRLTPTMQSNSGYLVSTDSATLNIGTVTNRGGSATASDNDIKVTFKVTVVDDPTIQTGETYWVSTGIEHYGGQRLWIGQLGFTISRIPIVVPPSAVSLDGQVSIPVGQPHKFTLDLQTRKRFSNVTASASTANAEFNSICRMEICGFGSGFCIDPKKTKASYTLENSTSFGHNGAATLPLDAISYGGDLNDLVNSVITIDVVILVPASAAGAPQQTLTATVTEDGTDITDTFAYTPAAAANLVDPPGSAISVTATQSCGSSPCTLVKGQAVNYVVTLTVPTGTTFSPVTVKFVSDYLADGTTPALGGCDLQLVDFYQIDDDIACLGAWTKTAHRLTAQAAQGYVVNLGGVMNMGYSGNSNAVIKLGGTVLFNENAVAGTVYNMKIEVHVAGNVESTTTLGSQLSATPTVWPTWPSGGSAPAELDFKVIYPSDSSEIPPGGFAIVQMKVTPEHSTQCPYILEVGATSANVRLLNYKVTHVGWKFKCSNRDAWRSMEGTISPGDGGSVYDTSKIDLGVVTASRWHESIKEVKGDKIYVEAIVQLSEDKTAVADASSHSIAMSALICSTRLWVAQSSVTAKYSSTYTLQTPIANKLDFATPVVDTVTPGGNSKIHHSVTLNVATCLTYVIDYTTDQTWMNITDVKVLTDSVGDYLPGLKRNQPKVVLGGNSEGQTAEVDLGSVCNILRTAPDDGDALAIGNMTFVLEISVNFVNTNTITRGSWGQVTANITVGNGVTTQQVSDKIAYKANLPKTKFELKCPATASSMKPGEIETCTLTANMVDDVLELLMDLQTKMNVTAVLNIMEAKVTSIGRNIAGDFNTNTEVNLTSSDGTTQNNKATVSGVARNTFTHLNISGGTYMEGDNDIVLSIKLQMTDATSNDPNIKQRLDVGVAVGTYMIFVSFQEFTVERDGSEVPTLDVDYSFTAGNNLKQGGSVSYHVNVSHAASSSAEPINLRVCVKLPMYMKYMNFVNKNTNDRFPIPTQDVSSGGVVLSIDRLFFMDSIQFTIETTIDAAFEFKNKESWKAATPLEVSYQITHRTGSTTPEDQYLSSPIKFVKFGFTVTPVFDGGIVAPCTSPVALGVGDGTVQDCQITSSFEPDATAKASHARLNGASAWKTEARGGSFLESRWLKVDLGRVVTLTSVSTQGGSSADIAKFDLLYSVNDALYKKAAPADEFNHQKSIPPPAANAVVQHNLQSPVTARYVVIQLTDYNFNTAGKLYNMLRVEFFGCHVGPLATDLCPDPDTVMHAYDRGFLVAGTKMFICDSKNHFESGMRREILARNYAFNWNIKPEMRCFVTSDGAKWDALPRKVHNIVGYLPSDNNAVFAILKNSRGYAKGDNFGSSWTLITTADYQVAAAKPDFVTHKSVPFKAQAGFTEETVGDFKATFDGMSRLNGGTWGPILHWNGCCTPQCKLNGIQSC